MEIDVGEGRGDGSGGGGNSSSGGDGTSGGGGSGGGNNVRILATADVVVDQVVSKSATAKDYSNRKVSHFQGIGRLTRRDFLAQHVKKSAPKFQWIAVVTRLDFLASTYLFQESIQRMLYGG